MCVDNIMLTFREQKEEPVIPEVSPTDSSVDIGILKFHPQKVEFKDLQAKPESGENPNKLIASLTEEEINEVSGGEQLFFYAV